MEVLQHPKRRYSRDKGDESPSVRVISLGGLNEIGKNMTVIECGDDMIIIDCGSSFPESEMFGIDLVIPDFTYITENIERVKGLIITHGHEDHIGAIPYFLSEANVPIYCTRLTKGLIENKLAEFSMKSLADIHEIEPGYRIRLGCMTIVPIHVNHSIPDAVGLAIETPAGTVITTGDFKIDLTPTQGTPTDLATFTEYGKKGVLLFLQDSTNAERQGFSSSEMKVGQSFEGLFEMAGDRRVIIATFASNIYRIQQIINLAVASGRKVCVSGRSMINNIEMAFELGYLTAPDNIIIGIDEVRNYTPGQVVVLTTGSQGEPLSALSRMARGTHKNISVTAQDFVIISATPIPGNEKMVTKVVNQLLKLGAEVIYESMYDVHVSGHAYQEELKLMLSVIKPKYFMPVHGEYKHLSRHASLAERVGVLRENIILGNIGEVYEISENGITHTETVPSGQIMVDGYGVGDVGSVVLRDRRLLSQDGIVIVVFTVDAAEGMLISGPDIVSRGFVYVKESEELIAEACVAAREVIEKYNDYYYKDWAVIKSKIKDEVARVLYKKTKRSPMVLPIVMEV